MSFFVSDSIKNLIDEDSFANQVSNLNSLNFSLCSREEIIFEANTFETIDFKSGVIERICFAVKKNLISNLILENNFILKIDKKNSSVKNYEVEIINITNVSDDSYYCKFNILKEV